MIIFDIFYIINDFFPQTVFQENVTILATMVDTFGERPSFVDLKPLRDKDIEADFFENIKHIQVRLPLLQKFIQKKKIHLVIELRIKVLLCVFIVDAWALHLNDAGWYIWIDRYGLAASFSYQNAVF